MQLTIHNLSALSAMKNLALLEAAKAKFRHFRGYPIDFGFVEWMLCWIIVNNTSTILFYNADFCSDIPDESDVYLCTYLAPRSHCMTISNGAWTPACLQLCASIVKIQVLYGDNMSKPNIRKITADPTKCNTDSSRRPSVFERLGTKPAITAASAQNTSDYCRNWALNGSCSYGKSCKWALFNLWKILIDDPYWIY